MRRLLEDPALRATMGRRALEKAAALSWDRGADGAMAAIRECADRASAR
jgi:hypothetical protein